MVCALPARGKLGLPRRQLGSRSYCGRNIWIYFLYKCLYKYINSYFPRSIQLTAQTSHLFIISCGNETKFCCLTFAKGFLIITKSTCNLPKNCSTKKWKVVSYFKQMLWARIAGELTSLHPFARESEELIHLHGFYFLTVMPCNYVEMGIIAGRRGYYVLELVMILQLWIYYNKS